jgi:hypothetical protein
MFGVYPTNAFYGYQQLPRVAVKIPNQFQPGTHTFVCRRSHGIYDAMARYLDAPAMHKTLCDQIMSMVPSDYDCCRFEEDGSCVLLFVMMNFKKHTDMFHAVIGHCTNFNSLNRNEESFLHLLRLLDEYSPFMGEYVSELISRGARPGMKNREGKTPFMKALEARNFTLAQILFNYKAQTYLIHGPFLHETVFHHIIRMPVHRETASFINLLNRVYLYDRTVMNKVCPMTGRRPIQDVIDKGFYRLLHKFVRNRAEFIFPTGDYSRYNAFANVTKKLDGRAFWILYQSFSGYDFDPLAPVPIVFLNGSWIHKDTTKPLEENFERVSTYSSISSGADPVYLGSPVAVGIIAKKDI